MSDVYLCVDQDGWTKGLQLSIGDDNGGFRIAGPKYNGSGKSLIKHKLTERDIAEITAYLKKATP